MSENGKGDKQRPLSVDHETFQKNWERAFGLSPAEQSELDEVVARVKRQQEARNFAKEFEDSGSV